MADDIPQFGIVDPAAMYVLRPGGYPVIVRSSGEIALVRVNGNYYLPGGGQDAGESAEAAAVREAMEECGAGIEILDRIGIADELVFSTDEGIHYRKRCTFFRARLLSDELSEGEADHALVWTPAHEAVSRLKQASQKWAVGKVT